MQSSEKTKKQLVSELLEARQQIAKLKAVEDKCKQAKESLVEGRRLAALLADVSVALIRGGTLRQALQDCAGAMVRHLDAAFARIWTLNAGQNALELQASAGMYTHIDGSHSRIPVGQYKIGLIAQQRQPHLTNTVIGDSLVHDQEWAKREGMVAFAGYPLVVDERLVGVVAMFSRQPLAQSTLHAIASVANQIALGIERKRAEEEQRRLTEQLREVNERLVVTSVEARELAEVAGRRASELQTVLDSIVDGVFVCDKDNDIVEVNRSGLRIVGLKSKEEALRPEADYLCLLDLRHPDGRPVTRNELVMARALRGEVVRDFEQLGRELRTGREVHFLISAAPIRDQGGEIVGAVAVMNDITRLREVDKLKDEFIGVAAHELKTPVAIMKGYAQVLLRTVEDMPVPRRKMLEAINRGADRIDSVVKDLLDVSRLYRGHLDLAIERVNLAELVEQVVDRMALTAPRHQIGVVGAEPVVVRGDPDRLEQALINLLDNAIKYSPQGGDVEVAVVVQGSEAVVSVTDRGVGIPRQKQEHIFERFHRAHTGTPYDYGGMGVGLYISKEIVVRHGGRMWFESEEGKGSTFYFSLPLSQV